MNILKNISDMLFPLFILTVVIFCIFSKNDLVKSFKKGAVDGFNTSFEILPNILLIMVGSALIKETGALSFLTGFISPFFEKIHIPPDLSELILMRPVSGSGSIALLKNLYTTAGADSNSGLIASVIAASTETTLYTVSVYFGATRVRKTLVPLLTGIAADIFTVFFAIFIVNLLF